METRCECRALKQLMIDRAGKTHNANAEHPQSPLHETQWVLRPPLGACLYWPARLKLPLARLKATRWPTRVGREFKSNREMGRESS